MYLHSFNVGNSECKIQIISHICRPAFFWIHVVFLLRYVNEMECSTAQVDRIPYITPFGQVNKVKNLIVIGECAHWFSRWGILHRSKCEAYTNTTGIQIVPNYRITYFPFPIKILHKFNLKEQMHAGTRMAESHFNQKRLWLWLNKYSLEYAHQIRNMSLWQLGPIMSTVI